MSQTEQIARQTEQSLLKRATTPETEQTETADVASSKPTANSINRSPDTARDLFHTMSSNSQRGKLARLAQTGDSATAEKPQAKAKPDGERIIHPSKVPGARPATDEDAAAEKPQSGNRAVNPAVLSGQSYKTQNVDGHAFVQGEGDDHIIRPADIQQGALGDCWVLSGLGALANTRRGKNIIYKMIKEIRSNGHVVAYDVTFPAGGWFGTEKTIRVDSSFPVDSGGNLAYAHPTEYEDDGRPELWVAVIEKAYAILRGNIFNGGTYGDIVGGFASDSMRDFTGQASRYYSNDDGNFPPPASYIQYVFDNDAAIGAGTYHNPDLRGKAEGNPMFSIGGGRQLVWGHDFMVVKVWGNGQHLIVRNPWGGASAETQISYNELKMYFRTMYINNSNYDS